MARGVKPVCLSMVIAEGVWRSPSSGAYSILGTFNQLIAQPGSLPSKFPGIWVFVQMIDVVGKVEVQFHFLRVSDQPPFEEILASSKKGIIEAKDRRSLVEFTTLMKDVPLPSEGEYRFALDVEGGRIMERMFVVKEGR